MSVAEIMHKNATCCDQDSTLDDLARTMWENDLGIVPIIDERKQLKGVVTDRDIAMAATLQHKPLWEMKASDLIANKQCHVCHPEDDIHDVLKMMSQSQVRRVPVLNGQGEVMGMIGMHDIVEHTTNSGKARSENQYAASELIEALRQVSRPNLPSASM
ncbi:CBS domain-containing protein [Marinobacter persicus]|uniref:CBS domain-containing protein n=2 Tax=Marinobacter persicus TaxID=930118 RepID=A0A2S6G726_9GAMM|nr:CBS domain-containing protein [Marinobacter persicus]KXS52473.1 MAG: hypothetical protein AWU57_3142 [Marinobacter sp. T13-3]PPK51925.1 CBS domain-containing protein [Marinobacter persicus]PPK54961.1 CBS domain-containing protein [Marinobacter persicus]PPK58322.1 CBS domain-containing protein [Marinobacter persicus]